MSVIVKGMEMPKGCGNCWFSRSMTWECLATPDNRDCADVRPQWCPLVELPEKHGYWNETKDVFECSECGYSFEHEGYKQYFNFCPCCGVKMKSEE